MRWQKKARLAIAAFVIVFVAIVVRRAARAAPAEGSCVDTAQRSSVDQRDAARKQGRRARLQAIKDGTHRVRIKFGAQRTYADGRATLGTGTITCPTRTASRYDHGREAE